MGSQIVQITLMNLRNIRSRLGTSSVIVVGIGGVVGVLIAILSLAVGFQAALSSSGDPERAIVLRGGSTTEMNGSVTVEQKNIIAKMPGVQSTSAEIYAVIDVPKKTTGTSANVIIRGLERAGFQMRPEVKLLAGRRFEEGRKEVMVGIGANKIFAGLNVGDVLAFRGGEWNVVGLFEAGGSAYESEIWGDANVINTAYQRQGVMSTVRVRLASAAAAAPLAESIAGDPRLDHQLLTEADYYSSQSEGMSSIISGFGYAVATIMAIGAIFAALNTMYSAVSNRTVEIATLRALGFGNGPIVISVMIEALILALIGGVAGAALVYFAVDGLTSSTLNSASFSQITFDYQVSRALVVQGLTWALLIGAVGGLFPAVRAARLPITAALRGE